ncbi:unnamed protein product [Cylindrotheca closterium]|uniref:Myosin motor domain-containing protein n=2 Tax=Bacillariophycidae TaxID=33850 RepID=A0AAD2GCS8_9STRA|nr:unnamed protein product [Cylindrotheca closterium]
MDQTLNSGSATEETSSIKDVSTHELKTANHAYVLDPIDSWIPCQVVERKTSTEVVVSIPQYRNQQAIKCDGGRSALRKKNKIIDVSKYSNQALPLQNVDEDGRLKQVEDMVDLPYLHEAAILYNLKERHIKSLPYTRTGDIVLACNPYQWFHDLYSWKQHQQYAHVLVWNDTSLGSSDIAVDPRTLLRPHVYEASCLAYKGLLRNGEDQSILVSGESGAGKTETVKILLGDLASVQRGPTANSEANDNEIVQRVLDSNPLLEAFGNAQTLRNDNSSRFGKFLQLQFDRQPGQCVLAGSKCEVYLLEKSRVTLHHPEERTYHVFYQLLAAPEDVKREIWEGFQDSDAESFDYIGWSETDKIEGKTDAERFQMTVDALKLVGIEGDTLRTLWRTICTVLQLGNLEFEPTSDDECRVASIEELDDLSSLMGVPTSDLSRAFTIRNIKAKSENFQVFMTAEKAQESADAFAKEIYAKTFLWLVRSINNATCAEKNYKHSEGRDFGIVGLLDIFGFESFEVNRFEQLCINYANEKLQQKFTQDIFSSVQEEYEAEGIELEEITYDDNTDVLDLVEGKMGLLAFLNEECMRPKGSDKTFVYKAQASNMSNPCFFRDKHAPDCEFGIRHYAGEVVYDAANFVVKNSDTLPSDLLQCAALSPNYIIANELNNDSMTSMGNRPDSKMKRRKQRTSLLSSKQMTRKNSNIAAETVWTKFRSQLGRLMDSLSSTQTRYIRCIKPNAEKRPFVMEHETTINQLRYAGVVAAVTISRSAFPNRLEHLVVLEKFKSLFPKGNHIKVLNDQHQDPEERIFSAVEILLTIALEKMEIKRNDTTFRAFVMGKSRAYFRAGALEFLEGERLRYLGDFAIVLQTKARSFVARSKYRKFKQATVSLQSNHRRRMDQRDYHMARKCLIKIQCWYRILCAARTIVHLRRKKSATIIQSNWRCYIDNRQFSIMKRCSVVIQTVLRGAIQRPKYRESLLNKREEAKLENRLVALQRKLEEAEVKRVEAEKRAEGKAAAAVEQYKEEQESKTPLSSAVVEDGSNTEKVTEQPLAHGAPVAMANSGSIDEESVEQQKLMDESGRMLEYLRKEVFKLRSHNQQLRTDFDLLKDNNQRLMDANASAGASFAALNQHAKQLSKENAQLVSEVSSTKAQMQKIHMLQTELKEELRMKQLSYVSEVQSRFQYQKALQKVADLIEASCRDYRLVQQVLEITDEVEMEHMTAGGNVTSHENGNEHGPGEPRSSIFSYLNPFSS